MIDNDFYEDDEDPENIHEAFEHAEKGLTQPRPARVADQVTWSTGRTYVLTWPS